MPLATLPGHPLLGSLPEFRANRVGLLHRVARDYGDIARVRIGFVPIVIVSSPELAHEVLVAKEASFVKSFGLSLFARPLLGDGLLTSERERHRTQRRLVAPAFAPRRIAAYAEEMVRRADARVTRMLGRAHVDVAEEAMHTTFDIVGKTLFDTEVSESASLVGSALTDAMDSMMGSLTAVIPTPPVVPTLRNLRLRRAVRRLDRIVEGMIQQRRRAPEDRGDLLSMLLLARDEDGKGGMTDRQVRDEAMTILLAGHETVANALAWTLYLLGRHPAVLARVEAELDGALAGRLPGVTDLPRLPLTSRVFKEAMRLYPPAYFMGRRATEPVVLGGHRLRKHQVVLINIAGIHRRADVHPDPDRFDPDRFTPEYEKALPRHGFVPFGAGPRICIGNHFAMMEGQLVLVTWLRRAHFELLEPGREVETAPILTLRPKGGVGMRVTGREGVGMVGAA